jgi:hypothetical protein
MPSAGLRSRQEPLPGDFDHFVLRAERNRRHHRSIDFSAKKVLIDSRMVFFYGSTFYTFLWGQDAGDY